VSGTNCAHEESGAQARSTTVVLDTATGQVKTSIAAGGDWSVHVRGNIREAWRPACGGHDFSQVWVARAPEGIRPPVSVGGRLTIDLPRRQVLVDGRPLELRAKEFDLLAALARRRDQVITKAELLEEVWGFAPRDPGDEHRIYPTMVRLRATLSNVEAGDLIRTVFGAGYELSDKTTTAKPDGRLQ
jgi:DNA-binding response OmpR family regulator